MDIGGKLNSLKAVAIGATIAGGIGILGTSTLKTNPNKALADKINKIMDNPNLRVAQTQSATGKGQAVNKNDGNPFGSTTTYHSYTWDVCEEWLDAETCKKWLDPYVSQHGFGDEKSVLEGKVSSLYAGMRDKKSENDWAIWNVQAKAGQSVKDEQGRLNRKGLAKFALKDEVKEELTKVGEDAARELMVQAVDKDEPKETMPNMESLRAMAGSLTMAYRNNLVGILGGLWRNKPGVEIPGGVNLTDCNVITSNQNSEETDEKLRDQGPLNETTRNVDLEKRVQLCQQLMAQSVRTVNPQVDGEQISSGDPNKEPIDEALARLGIAVVDDLTKNVSNLPKPADLNLTQEQLASAVSISENGTEKTVYEMPKDQIEAYNEMLKNAADSWKQMSNQTKGHIASNENLILSHQVKGPISAVKINLAKKAQRNLAGENVSTLPTNDFEMTPQELIDRASQ
ncbi:MAG: hypothetical protein ACKN9V_03885 [Pseudomonadota bacterium]